MHRNLIAACAALALPFAAMADEEGATVEFETLKPDLAVTLAQATLEACREGGYQVAVAVVDRFGQTQAVIRDRFAGPHTVATATGKAWTSVSFRTATLELDERIEADELSESLRDIPGALMLGGGVPVLSAGSIVAGVGVSGAPDPALDEECAEAGIDAIADELAF